jgi:hypothetical protein
MKSKTPTNVDFTHAHRSIEKRLLREQNSDQKSRHAVTSVLGPPAAQLKIQSFNESLKFR